MTKSFDVITRLIFEIDETEYFELSKVLKHYVIKLENCYSSLIWNILISMAAPRNEVENTKFYLPK